MRLGSKLLPSHCQIKMFVGKIRLKCVTNKGVSKEGVSPKHRPKEHPDNGKPMVRLGITMI